MKKIYIVLMCFLVLLLTACSEEEKRGDILTDTNDYLMSETKELDILNYHMIINVPTLGMEYNNTIFSYLINNEEGMYLYNYNSITNNINLDYYLETIMINDKEYKYYIDNDTINLIYNIDNNYYLNLSIKAINNDTNNENINSLIELFNFEIEEK